jgi:SAM-dependent methyltransferase
MSEADRERWNETWRTREPAEPAAFLVEHEALLPRTGRALDVAGGAGRHALWLAARGLDVTLVDVSEVGLARAAAANPAVRTERVDLEEGGALPAGPFELVLCWHFLDRAHRDRYVDVLAPGGVLVIAQPTVLNLERHERPSRRFLAEPGELDAWVRDRDLEIVVSVEGWNGDGRHEAAVIAAKR